MTDSPSDLAAIATQAIVADLAGRARLGDAWSSIDEDARAEIVSEWLEIVSDACSESFGAGVDYGRSR